VVGSACLGLDYPVKILILSLSFTLRLMTSDADRSKDAIPGHVENWRIAPTNLELRINLARQRENDEENRVDNSEHSRSGLSHGFQLHNLPTPQSGTMFIARVSEIRL